MKTIDIRDLRRVMAIAKTGSFTRAAENVGISQSVLTRCIQDVERDIGARLFDREQGGVRLTGVGADIIPHASAVLRSFEDFNKYVDEAVSGKAGRVSIGVAPTVAAALVPQIAERLLLDSKETEVYLPVRRPETLRDMLLDDEIDVCVCPEAAFHDVREIESSEIGTVTLGLFVRANHPLLLTGEVDPPGQFPLISATYFHDVAYFSQYFPRLVGNYPKIVLEDHECLSLLTERSDAIWVTSTAAVLDAVERGRLIKLPESTGADGPTISIMMYRHKGRTLSPIVRGVLEEMTSRLAWLHR